jgi:hypothetical protein
VNVRLVIATSAIAVAVACTRSQALATKVCAFAIPADMIDKVDSNKARVGGDFRFKTTGPVTLEDGTIVPIGTIGYGVIRSASAAGRRNHDGMLSLEPRYLMVKKAKGALRRIDVTMTPTLPVTWGPSEPMLNKAASHIPLPIPGLVMTGVNQIRWGRDITLGPGFTFSVIPIGDLAKSPIC